MLRDVATLVLSQMEEAPDLQSGWSEGDAALLRREAGRLLHRQSDAAIFLAPHAERLVGMIDLVPFIGADGGPFGPAWPGHPFLSPGMRDGIRPTEPQLTRALANLLRPSAGRRGAERTASFLRVLTDLAGQSTILDTLGERTRPTVTPEHVIAVRRRGSTKADTDQTDPGGLAFRNRSAPRIDLLFEWPVGADGRQAVVAIEAKLGANVGEQQLKPYREEAKRRAKGGPVALILLLARADKAERRYRSWSAVRWFALMRRWEPELAAAGDEDPEFARVRAYIWRFILNSRSVFR